MQITKILKAHDGKKIAVEINSLEGNEIGILYFHGFTGSINGHNAYNAANTWPKKGYDFWRMNICPGGEGFRDMGNLRFGQSVEDAKRVIATMHRKYKKIFVVGHSLGGTLAVYAADKKLAGIVLWDPPYDLKLEGDWIRDYDKKHYLINYGNLHLITKAYAKEVDKVIMYPKMKELPCPAVLIKGPDSHYSWPEDRLHLATVLIDGADHSFHKEGMQDKLFAATLKFIKGVLAMQKKTA